MENNIQNEELLAMVKSKIYTIRGQKVMLDFDLAAMYGVKTGRLNEQVKRNIERFPEDFMFQLTKGELEILRSQFLALQANGVRAVIANEWKSQNATSNLTDNQHEGVLISQIATSKNQGDRSLICSPKMRIEKRKSVSGFRFFVSKAVLSRQHCSCDTMGSVESVTRWGQENL